MKDFLVNRVSPFICAFSILISLCVIPVSADFDHAFADSGSVLNWEARINSPASSIIDVIAQKMEVESVYTKTFWGFVDRAVAPHVGSISMGELQAICSNYNQTFNQPLGETFFGQLFRGTADIYSNSIAGLYLGNMSLNFDIQKHPSSGLYRIKETTTDLWVVTSVGSYPYAEFLNDGETEAGDQWIGEVTAQDRAKGGAVALHTLDRINLICNRLKNEGISVQLKTLNDASGKPKYQGIWHDRQFYADPNGNPYVAPYNPNEWASNQDRPDTSVKDENGNEIEGLPEDNETGLDLENMLIYLPNGSIGMIDTLIYDESTKSYHIDSHDTYNTEINYYYEWNYYINYTSITYIGQSEEYNKYYEVYYELPDGRDSADLTKEDVEQLNLSVDVIPYERHTDDTSLRSLYHFDGDTKDSSYWNYYTDFTWNTGASLTYMDAGVFDGALYLDENEHDFTLKLPGSIGYGDFTLQFRYYQSHTLAPQTDSYISFDPYTSYYPLKLDGANLKLDSDTVGADDIDAATISTGQWNEIAIVRHDGVGYWYLNGVLVGTDSALGSVPLGEAVTFHFGDAQETFKYLDELRILDYALVEDGEAYEPTSVPYDTNLTLVLPASEVAVADEYWEITSSKENLLSPDMADWSTGSAPENLVELEQNVDTYQGILDEVEDYLFPQWGYRPSFNTFYSGMNSTGIFTRGDSFVTETPYLGYGSDEGDLYLRNGIFSSLSATVSGGSAKSSLYEEGKTYTLSMVAADGSIGSVSYTIGDEITGAFDSSDYTIMFNGYRMGFVDDYFGNPVMVVQPAESKTLNYFVYLELVEGSSTDLSAEKVSSVVGMEKDALNTPTLAVRTDLEITSYQIGGVRPSLPKKGQVWALVENERITSIQIYNGQAWEGVDGRIWTGSRWIPASSYNIITLQDMYDIVDSTQDFEYIYSEAGFWAWFQRAWNAFMVKVDQIIILLSGGSICQHTYTSEITREASCAVPGTLLYTCTLCEHTYEEEIPATGHNWKVTGQFLNGMPTVTFVDSIDQCVDTTKDYVLPDGYIYRYTELSAPNLFNYDEVQLGRPGSSDGGPLYVGEREAYFTTGFIPVDLMISDNITFFIRGDAFSSSLFNIYYVEYYDSSQNFLYKFLYPYKSVYDIDGGIAADIVRDGLLWAPSISANHYHDAAVYRNVRQNAGYIRFSFGVRDDYAWESARLLYEAGEYGITSITSSIGATFDWVNTGMKLEIPDGGYNELLCSVCGATAKDYGSGPEEIILPDLPDPEPESNGFWDKIKEALSSGAASLITTIFELFETFLEVLVGTVVDLFVSLFDFLTETVLGGIKDFFASLDTLLDPFRVENEDGTTSAITDLPEGIASVFAFFSGLFMILPMELRLIMMLGIGLMVFLAVLKMVKS